jgi:hypothetical protein
MTAALTSACFRRGRRAGAWTTAEEADDSDVELLSATEALSLLSSPTWSSATEAVDSNGSEERADGGLAGLLSRLRGDAASLDEGGDGRLDGSALGSDPRRWTEELSVRAEGWSEALLGVVGEPLTSKSSSKERLVLSWGDGCHD